MTPPAHVTSIEALATFRAQLIVYLEKASRAAADVTDDLVRLRTWLQEDQRLHWEAQIHRRTRELEAAQQELFSARMSGLREATAAQQMAVARAKRALAEAQAKLELTKRWGRRYEGEVAPLAKQVERLRDLFANDMRKAAPFLARAVNALEAYAERTPSPATSSLTPPGSSSGGEVGGGVPGPSEPVNGAGKRSREPGDIS